MLIRKIAALNIVLNTAITATIAVSIFKRQIEAIAETETAHSAGEYVMVRMARGHYFKTRGLEMLLNDYKFFGIIQNFHEYQE